MRCMSRSTILLNVGLVSSIFLQLRNEGIHNIVTVIQIWSCSLIKPTIVGLIREPVPYLNLYSSVTPDDG